MVSVKWRLSRSADPRTEPVVEINIPIFAQQSWRLKRQSPQNLQAGRPAKGHLTEQSLNLSLIDIFFCAAPELINI
jgi:hypothetical protein